jgi:hypothetical protein
MRVNLLIINAFNDDFNLNILLPNVGILTQNNVYINWYQFDNIDKMHFGDLSNYFDDIWYPESDDIDIFDDTFLWVLSIYHYGGISTSKVKSCRKKQENHAADFINSSIDAAKTAFKEVINFTPFVVN